MPLPTLFYVCINDGSDTRVNKEIKTLSKHFEIVYLGIGRDESNAFMRRYCQEFHLIQGHHKSIITLSKYFLKFINLYLSKSYNSIHVINEQLLIIFLPFFLWRRTKVVADIFDSIFLRSSSKILRLFQAYLYKLPKYIIVTDENRKTLVPPQFLDKTIVVENYPYTFNKIQPKVANADELLILYSGSLGVTRGTIMLQDMVNLSPKVKVWMVGWIYDDSTKNLKEHPQVTNWGVKTQQETMQLASQCDYILSVYAPVNDNNLNASPNKIYDAIQAKTPVIINREIKVASFVADKNIGFVMDSFYEKNLPQLIDTLIQQKKKFVFDAHLHHTYTWEAVEDKLVQAHRG